MLKYTPIILTILLLFASPVMAQNEARDWRLYDNGIAMHGEPKQGANDTHLDYANPNAPIGGHLKTAASKGTFDTLNPYALKGTAAEGLNLIYDRLMARRWNEPFTMYPMIAEKIAVPDDRSVVTFHLNPEARFNDGSPITADDVIFSYETLKEKGRPNMRRIYRLAESVIKEDDHTVTFKFGEGYDRETVMIFTMMPVLSKAFWSGRDFEATLLKPPVTSGPYEIESIDAGRSITYKRNPDYWAHDLLANKGHHNFERITYDYFRDSSVALEAFNKGDLNYRFESDISKWMSAYPEDARIVKYEAPHQRPEKARGFIFNMRRPPFDDINVRKALALAFDAEWIGKNIYYGKGKRSESFFPNSSLQSRKLEKLKRFSIRKNLKRAAELLENSGWMVEGGQRMKDGETLNFEALLSQPEEEKIALNLKKHLQRLGITMNIRVLDTASFQKRRQEYDYDIILHHWQNSLSPGTEQMLYWTCEAAKTPGQFNYSGLCDEEIDTLAAQIADAKDYAELTTLTRTLDKKLQDQHMIIPLFYSGVDHIAHDSALKHPEETPIYGSALETWWMDENAP